MKLENPCSTLIRDVKVKHYVTVSTTLRFCEKLTWLNCIKVRLMGIKRLEAVVRTAAEEGFAKLSNQILEETIASTVRDILEATQEEVTKQ